MRPDDYNAKRRKRYAEDPAYRERLLAAGQKSRNKRRRSDAELRERERIQGREYNWRKRYKLVGMTAQQYERMLARQHGRCRICRREPSNKMLGVDHRHATGEVRGLLCLKCNFGLGNFDDSPARLVRAAMYLIASLTQEAAVRLRASALRFFKR